jgi:hypothetical protein
MKYIICWRSYYGDYRNGGVSAAGSKEFETEKALHEGYNCKPTYWKCYNVQAFAVHHKIELKSKEEQ